MATGLSFEYILRHDSDKPHCSDRAREHRMQDVDDIITSIGYAEPGYDDPEVCVLLGNWNDFSQRAYDLLERAGYSLEWSDEWTCCDGCGKALRTSPDSYGWQQAGVLANGCEFFCLGCVDWAEHLESIEDDDTQAVRSSCNPAEFGYQLVSQAGEFENGLHVGQNDKPKDILKKLHDSGHKQIVFRISGVGQFDVAFEAWEKISTDNADGTND